MNKKSPNFSNQCRNLFCNKYTLYLYANIEINEKPFIFKFMSLIYVH